MLLFIYCLNNTIFYSFQIRSNKIREFSPDVAILLLDASNHSDSDNQDIKFLIRLKKEYEKLNKIELPVIVVINKCDALAPFRYVNPRNYPTSKIKNIQLRVTYVQNACCEAKLDCKDVIPISSLIDWKTQNGIEVTAEEIKELPANVRENLQIAFDGRYNLQTLLNVLEDAIQDNRAKMGLRIATRLEQVVHTIASRLTKTFSAISATIALIPCPVADIYPLLITQAILITLISSLSGREINIQTALEFIGSIAGTVGIGYGCRELARQALKFFPGIGTAGSSIIAATATYSLGNAAISYYIDGTSEKEVKEKFNKENLN